MSSLPMPLKKRPSEYMTRGEVRRLCRRHRVSDHKMKQMFCQPDSPARKLLPGAKYHLYIRRVVVDALGLSMDD